MRKVYISIFALILVQVKSQVGINTPNPLANLEVRRSELPNIPDGIIPPRISADSLQMKDHLYGPAQNGTLIYITKPVSKNTSKTQQITSSGYYVYDSHFSNKDKSKGTWKKMFSDPNAFAARSTASVSFAKLTLASSGSDFQSIRMNAAFQAEIGSEYLVDNQYEVPETGLYMVNYYINVNNTDNSKITGKPSLAIVKVTTESQSRAIMASKSFEVFSSQASINHIYNLKQGEKLNFGLIADDETLLALGGVSSEISIYKIR